MAAKKRKKLTVQQEFDIMKLVLDKFLWLGFILMVFGLWEMYNNTFSQGFLWIIAGAVVLIIFMIMIVKEYEILA